MKNIHKYDNEIYEILKKEISREESTLELIASENFTSKPVMEMAGSVMTNKYAEGYPGKRYYGGCEFVDEAENMALDIKSLIDFIADSKYNKDMHKKFVDYLKFYEKGRSNILANNAMVATSQPLAAQAGLKILLEGGNAVDAAIATASALTVVEPTMNGIGSDAFAIVYKDGNLFGLNASGKSPATWTPKRFSKC